MDEQNGGHPINHSGPKNLYQAIADLVYIRRAGYK